MECIICGEGHDVASCRFPQNVNRCPTCQCMVFEHHTCNNNALVSAYSIQPLASQLQSCFKLRTLNNETRNGVDMLYLNAISSKFEKISFVLSAATSGIFTMDPVDKYNILEYRSTKIVKFQFHIALLEYNHAKIALRAVVTKNGVKFMPCDDEIIMYHNGKYRINDEWKMVTAFILGLQMHSQHHTIQVRQNGQTSKAQFDAQNGWNIDAAIDVRMHRAVPVDAQVLSDLRCFNCNGDHNVLECDMPAYTVPCSNCLVISLDGSQHKSPCMPINRISSIRKSLSPYNALTVFQLVFENDDLDMMYLHDGSFQEMGPNVKLMSSPAESLFLFKNSTDSKRQCIELRQATFKRCSIVLAYLDSRNIWRIRFRLVITKKHGLLVFPVTRTLTFTNQRIDVQASAPQDSHNVVQIFGWKPKSECVYFETRIFANESGDLSSSKFDGYTANFGLDFSGEKDVSHIDDALDPSKATEKTFNKQLYVQESQPLLTFQAQRATGSETTITAPDDDTDSCDWTSEDSE